MGYDTVQSGRWIMFRRKVLPPSSRYCEGGSMFIRNVDTRLHGVVIQTTTVTNSKYHYFMASEKLLTDKV
jgi:hypothetical protein